MTKQLCLILMLLCPSFVEAQNVDSLLQRVETLKEESIDSNLYLTYYEIVKKMYSKDKDSTIVYLKKALEAAQWAFWLIPPKR